MSKRKTIEEFKQEVFNMYNNEYEVVSKEYINNTVNILFRHNCEECGYNEFEMTPKNFLKGQKCPICSHDSYNDYKFKKKVKELTGNQYEVLGEYINGNTKIKIKHVCGNIYEVRPRKFLEGKRCPNCNRPNYCTDIEMLKERFNRDRKNNSYKFIEKINDRKILISHICDDGIEYKFNMYVKDIGKEKCPRCEQICKRRDDVLFKEDLYNIFREEIIPLEEFKGVDTKIKVMHNSKECNFYNWHTSPSILLSGHGCPCCNISKGENKIKQFLIDNDEFFIKEYKFNDLLSKKGNQLRFDFGVFDRENKLKLLIEYDGEFHYLPLLGQDELMEQKSRDNLKNLYCKNNKIELLRIPYWKFNDIENILKDNLLSLDS